MQCIHQQLCEFMAGGCEHWNVPSHSEAYRLLKKVLSCIRPLFCDDETLKCVCMTTYCQHTSLLEFNTYQLKSEQFLNNRSFFYTHTVKHTHTHTNFLFLVSNLISMIVNMSLITPSTKCTYYMYTPYKTLFSVIHFTTFITCTCIWNNRSSFYTPTSSTIKYFLLK